MSRLTVRDVMSEKVITAREDTPFKALVELMMMYDISAVPVLGEDGRLTGIVTEADLLAKEAGSGARGKLLGLMRDALSGGDLAWTKKAAGRESRDVMTRPVRTARPGEPLRSAARRMLRARVKRLPVIDGERVIGMLSRHDVLTAFDQPDSAIRRTVEHALRDSEIATSEDIRVGVSDGIVSLRGAVEYTSDARVLATLAAAVDGVIAVENELRPRSAQPKLRA